MSGTLYSLPLGGSMEAAFLEEARKRPYRDTLFLVPNRFYLQRIRQNRANAISIDKLPREILRANDRLEGARSVTRPAQKKVLEDALQYLEAKGSLTYFGSLKDRTGFRDNLLALFDEFTRAGLDWKTFHEALQAWGRTGSLKQKDLELDQLYTIYTFQLQEKHLLDLSQLYARAAEVLEEEGTTVPWKQCFFLAFYQFDPVQLRLVKALAKKCDVAVAVFYDPRRPELSAATEKIHSDLQGAGFAEVKVQARRSLPEDLTAFDESWNPGARWGGAAPSIHLGEGGSPETELRLALTSMKDKLQDGASPEDFVVIVRKMADYQGLVRSFAQYGIPCRLPQVTDLAGQPLPDFLTKLLAAATDREDLAKWQDLLRCTLMAQLFAVDRDALEEEYTRTYFASADDYRFYLKKDVVVEEFWELLDFFQTAHTPKEWQAGLQQRLDDWQLPQAWGERYRAGQSDLLAGKVLGLTVDFVTKTLQELVKSLEQCGEGDAPLAPKEFQTFWQESLTGKTLPLVQGDPRGVRVLEAGSVEGVDFPYVYILGLREGLFPQVKRESWLYSDKERALLNALGVELSLTARALETDRYFFGSAVALATKELHLSWYRDEEGGPSSYIQELENFYAEGSLPVTVYQDGPDTCASKPLLVNLLAEQPALGPKEEGFLLDAVGQDFPARCATVTARWETKCGPWNGQVDPKPIRQLQRPLHLSASSLDDYLQCPFAMLVGRLWKLQPWQDKTAWPTPDVVGNLLHQTLAAFLGNHLDESLGDRPEKELQQELKEIYEASFQKLVEDGLIPQSPLLSHIRRVYGTMLSIWLHKERGYQQQDGLELRPHQLEWAFGRKGSPWPALTREVDGEKVYFSGQIDRIDKNGSEYAVLDYKSGTPPTGGDLTQGKVVQLPLYMDALETLGKVPREKILGGGYCALKTGERSGGLWNPIVKDQQPWMKRKRPTDLATVEAAAEASITKVVQGLRQGEFPARPADKCPDWCPAKDICRIAENPNLLEQEDE